MSKNNKPQALEELTVIIESADPKETLEIKEKLGYIDGQIVTAEKFLSSNFAASFASHRHFIDTSEIWQLFRDSAEEIFYHLSSTSYFVIDPFPLIKKPEAPFQLLTKNEKESYMSHLLEIVMEVESWVDDPFIRFPGTPIGLELAKTWLRLGKRAEIGMLFNQKQFLASRLSCLGLNKTQISRGVLYRSGLPCVFSISVGSLFENFVDGSCELKNVLDTAGEIDSLGNLKINYSSAKAADSNSLYTICASSLSSTLQVQSCLQKGVKWLSMPYKTLVDWYYTGFEIPKETIWLDEYNYLQTKKLEIKNEEMESDYLSDFIHRRLTPFENIPAENYMERIQKGFL
jgi:hypothetical protein